LSFSKIPALVGISLLLFGTIFGLFYTNAALLGLEHSLKAVLAIFAVLLALWLIFAISLISHYEHRLGLIERLTNDTIHEIATPTATIKANCKMLKTGKSDEKELRKLERIELCADRLNELYATLEWRIKNDFSICQKEAVYIDKLCKECICVFEQQANEKGVRFDLILEPLTVEADPYGAKITVSNLIDNAVKYCLPNSVIKIVSKNNALSIENVGKELNAEQLIGIYDRYFRVESDGRGFGIGLSIVKNFCDANNAVVKIQSEQNGTKVTLVFNKLFTFA
jgi:two-component system, OmpR family, sensor kinase